MKVNLPLDDGIIEKLRAGDKISLNGPLLVARDAAHKRIMEALERGERPPVDFTGQVVYYMGPSPPKPGQVIGAAGPTTSGRMDVYVRRMLELGMKGMLGKGGRSSDVKESLKEYRAVYLAALGGAGALISKTIKSAKVLAYDDLGAEALRLLEVEDLPAWVINDIYGGDLYVEGARRYRIEPRC
jgi:fumarate hydratase subunit beta